jgi:hypothetical protein
VFSLFLKSKPGGTTLLYVCPIGIVTKWGILIDETTWIKFENDGGWYFQKDDVIGIGIIHQPNSKLECFATFNGKLLGEIFGKKIILFKIQEKLGCHQNSSNFNFSQLSVYPIMAIQFT